METKKNNWKIGDTYRQNGYKYHIVAIVEDDGKTLYVVKYYGKYKQWWHYEIAREFENKLV